MQMKMEPNITNMVAWRTCTPFCDKNTVCPEHHELLQGIVNCTDQLGHLSNIETLKNNVEKYQNLGWDKNSDIPDAVSSNRLPIIHWAACLGKCNALEWMVNSGFKKMVTNSQPENLGENAIHRCVLYLYRSRPKFTTKELRPKFRRVCNLLSPCLSEPDSIHGNTPLHTACYMLVHSDTRLVFFMAAIDVMANQANNMMEHQRSNFLDARNNEGETCLHMLAQINEKAKIDFACQSIATLLRVGADKTVRNDSDQTPLEVAMARGCNNIVEELVKIVDPSEVVSTSPTIAHDPRSLMTMVDIPSRSHHSPATNGNSYYTPGTPRSPTRSRSPHRSSSRSPILNSTRYDDIPVVEPSYNIKHEDLVDSSNGYPTSPSSLSDSTIDVNSPLLSHLREAGLLNEVSNLLSRAKTRDESQLRRYRQQAKDLDTQIVYKLKEIERINQEVESLRIKRRRCEDEEANLRKRLSSCSNAIKELPENQANGVAVPNGTGVKTPPSPITTTTAPSDEQMQEETPQVVAATSSV